MANDDDQDDAAARAEAKILERDLNEHLAGKSMGTLQPIAVVTPHGSPERRQKLGDYFRTFLADWLGRLMSGVRFSPDIAGELMSAFVEMAAVVACSLETEVAGEPDAATNERIAQAALAALAAIVSKLRIPADRVEMGLKRRDEERS